MGTTTQNLWQGLITALDVYSVILFFVYFVLGVVACFAFFTFFFRKEIRLFKNRKRPIMIFKSAGEDMEIETKLLRDSQLFNIPEEPTDKHQNIDRIKNHSLIIIGYSAGMTNFEDIFNGAKNAGIPVIIYSKDKIPDDIFNKLRNYSWYSSCQVPLRLINDVFTILSTFPNK
jgi:hypothetical protein